MLLVAATLAVLYGCDPGEDTWATYLATGEFQGGAPSISPVSQDVVYCSPRSGHGDIFRHSGIGRPPVRLTSDHAFEGQPLFSPDGETIAYVKESGGYRHIWLMGNDGSNQRQLTAGGVLDDISSFSPDGRAVYFVRCGLSSGPARDAKYFRVGVDGLGLAELPRSALPVRQDRILSSDGKHSIDFGSARGQRTLVRRLADGQVVAEVEMPAGSKSLPCTTNRNQHIVFTCIEPGSRDARVYVLDTSTFEISGLD